MIFLDSKAARLATRLSFFVAGFGMACWAPLIPFISHNLQLNNEVLGMMLLCMGLGSVSAMVITGAISSRHGSKSIIVLSGISIALLLTVLPLVETPAQLAITLIFFGAAVGSLDVSMNIHSVEVDNASVESLLSGFHAMYSVGGFAGSALITFLLSHDISTSRSTMIAAGLMIILMLFTWPRLAQTSKSGHGQFFSLPHGIVLILASLAGILFLVEGAMLDWSALFITDSGLVSTEKGGLPFIVFSVAMLTGRFLGDAITNKFGDRKVMFTGGLVALSGILIAIAASNATICLLGFLLIGAGASNIVPILFRLAGSQKAMPTGLAVASISTVGYAGILLGPALIGFVSHHIGLTGAFGLLALLLSFVPICAFLITKRQ